MCDQYCHSDMSSRHSSKGGCNDVPRSWESLILNVSDDVYPNGDKIDTVHISKVIMLMFMCHLGLKSQYRQQCASDPLCLIGDLKLAAFLSDKF